MFFNRNNCGCNKMPNMTCNPIIEPVVERCVTKDTHYVQEHICPIHTTVINNHIIEHKYRPEYTESVENVFTNVDPGCCNRF